MLSNFEDRHNGGDVGKKFTRGLLAGWAVVFAGTAVALNLGINTDDGLWFQAVCAYLAVGAAAGAVIYRQFREVTRTIRIAVSGTLLGIFINLLIDMIVTFSSMEGTLTIGRDISEHVFWFRVILQTIIAIPVGAAFGLLMCLRSTLKP